MWALFLLAQSLVLVNGGWDKSRGVFRSNSTSFADEFAIIQAILQLKPGMTYCEMGAGEGKFMVPLGKSVMPSGRIMVTEAANTSLPILRSTAQRAGLEASVALATDASLGLPADACDVIMSRMVYHMINETAALATYLPQLSQALRRGGKMLILDHDPDNGGTTRADATLTGKMHKMPVVPRLQEIMEFTSAGFALVRTLEWPWFGEHEHGYALLWIHAGPTSQEQQALPTPRQQGVFQEFDGVNTVGIAGAIFAGISAVASCCILCLVFRLSGKISRILDGRGVKVPTDAV